MVLPDFLTRDADDEIRLTGHRIGLFTLVRRYQEGCSVAELTEEYPSLPLEHIQKVISFYLNNRADVDHYVAAYQLVLEQQAGAATPGKAQIRIRKLVDKLEQAERDNGAGSNWAELPLMEKIRRIEKESEAENR